MYFLSFIALGSTSLMIYNNNNNPHGIIFSYVDDFTITLGSLSYWRNCKLFQYLYSVLKRRGAKIGVSFSVAKTELCHCRIPKDRDSTSRAAVCLDATVFHPSSSVRWCRNVVVVEE